MEQTRTLRLDATATGLQTPRTFTAQGVTCVVRGRCLSAHRPLTEAHLDARRQPCVKTPSSSSFADWFKCGSRTRDTRFTRPLLYPSELTCGGMKQRIRAVRARATLFEAQARQVGRRTHCRCTIGCFYLVTGPRQCAAPNPPHLAQSKSHRPKRRNPGRQRRPGSHEEMFRGLPSGQPRNSKRRANASHHPRHGVAHRKESRDSLRDFSAPSAAASQIWLIDNS